MAGTTATGRKCSFGRMHSHSSMSSFLHKPRIRGKSQHVIACQTHSCSSSRYFYYHNWSGCQHVFSLQALSSKGEWPTFIDIRGLQAVQDVMETPSVPQFFSAMFFGSGPYKRHHFLVAAMLFFDFEVGFAGRGKTYDELRNYTAEVGQLS